jgi:periplasmic protein TonB
MIYHCHEPIVQDKPTKTDCVVPDSTIDETNLLSIMVVSGYLSGASHLIGWISSQSQRCAQHELKFWRECRFLMAYADQQMSTSRMVSIGFVALLHAGVGYALVTGLAYDAAQAVLEDLKTFDVQEEKLPEPEEPPPPPEKLDIPPPPKVTVPPPIVKSPITTTNTQQPVTQAAAPAPPPPPLPPPPPPSAPPPPPPPPPPPKVAQKATLRSGSISDEDYPPSAIRNEEAGTSVANFTIGTDGRVVSCNASGAGASLDAETCKLIMRRFRYKAALDTSGAPIEESKTQRVTWRLPK